MNNILISGSSGSIASALIDQITHDHPNARIFALSQKQVSQTRENVINIHVDYLDEDTLQNSSQTISEHGSLDMILCTNGILHTDAFMPEKALRDLNASQMIETYQANTIVPSLIAKHFVPLLSRDQATHFAALSARVGSISDNRLGGWHSYRASKAALNMMVKNIAIEMKRKNPLSIAAGIHPGTVDSPLSLPFQKNIPEKQLFSPQQTAHYILKTLAGLTPEQSGQCFAWDGAEIKA